MKTNVVALILLLFSFTGFSQNPNFEYQGRFTSSVQKEKLMEIKFIGDISSELWHNIGLPYKDLKELNFRKKIDCSQDWYTYISPKEYDYSKIIDYVFVEIVTTSKGKTMSAQSISDKLTIEQKNILSLADLGSDIKIKIKFKYKNLLNDKRDNSNAVIEGESVITVVPETEAEYPGGSKQLAAYFKENIYNKIYYKNTPKLQQVIVKFTVSEQGKIVNARIQRASSDMQIDKLILDAINKMPKWKPAKNADGSNVEQEFVIPFGNGNGGC